MSGWTVQAGHVYKLTCRLWWCSKHPPGFLTREARLSGMRSEYRRKAKRR